MSGEVPEATTNAREVTDRPHGLVHPGYVLATDVDVSYVSLAGVLLAAAEAFRRGRQLNDDVEGLV